MDTLIGKTLKYDLAAVNPGCTKTVCSKTWLNCYLESLSLEKLDNITRERSETIFKFVNQLTLSTILCQGKLFQELTQAFPHKVNIGNTFNEQVFDKDMIIIKCFNEQLIEDLQNNNRANKKAFLETKLCRYDHYKLEKLKVTLSEESRSAKLRL